MSPNSPTEPPFQSGAQRTVERRAVMPKAGGGVAQAIIIGLSLLVVLAAIAWALVPFGG